MLSLFANPFTMIAGALLISSPIIIHLINRMRYKRVRWAAMEFLLKSQKRSRRKLIIEQNIAPAGGLNDYKFTCANGHILHGRLDVGRFTSQHQRALFTVPGFEIIPVEYGGLKMPAKIERPPHLAIRPGRQPPAPQADSRRRARRRQALRRKFAGVPCDRGMDRRRHAAPF